MVQTRTVRVGLTAILLALCLRIAGTDLPARFFAWLRSPQAAAVMISLETGREVRFSPSLPAIAPDFAESSPISETLPREPPLPVFSDGDRVALFRASGVTPDVAALLKTPLSWDLRGEGPTVLILHTHATESYTKQGEDYRETAAWRTDDENYNMLSIGALVAQRLEEAGISTIQDRTLHDYPSYNGSYVSSRKSLRAYLEQYPTIRLVLDLHRDAGGTDTSQMRTEAKAGDRDSAQLMVVLGTNHENYEENLSLGAKLHVVLERQCPGITRPLQLREARYNQDLCPGALLIEVGAAGNSHEEAAVAAGELAKAIITLAEGSG